MLYSEDALMKANRDVTESLQRTIALMQKELERSVLSTQLLGKFLLLPLPLYLIHSSKCRIIHRNSPIRIHDS